MAEIILILLAVLAGAFTQRVVGFGMPILVFPATLIFFKPTSALIITLLVGVVSGIVIARDLRSNTKIDFKIIRAIIPASLVGIIIGAYILTIISKSSLQIFLGLSIIVSLNIQRYFLPKPKEKIKVEKNIHLYGLLSGFFKSTVGLSAAPLIVWIRFYIIKPNQIRLLLAYYFLIMNILAIASIQAFENNALTGIPGYLLLGLIPAVLIANYLGSITAGKVDKRFYDQLAYFVLMLAGIITFAAGLKDYL